MSESKISKKVRYANDSQEAVLVPAIPYEKEAKKTMEKGHYQAYKLRTLPADPDSPVYEIQVAHFESGTPEEWLKFMSNIDQVFAGQDVTTGPPQYSIVRSLLKGDALTVFNTNAATLRSETVSNLKDCLSALTTHIFPVSALQIQKRYMRRLLKKPTDVPTKDHVARVMELNNYLPRFPDATTTNGKLSEEDIMDLLEFSLPGKWVHEMKRQGFVAVKETPKKFISFCENIEAFERYKESMQKQDSKPKDSKRKRSNEGKRGKDTKSERRTYYCENHGENVSHDTKQCRLNKRPKYDKKPGRGSPSTKELNALVKAQIAKAFSKAAKSKKKEQYAFEKFRDLQVSDESEDDNEKPVERHKPMFSSSSSSDEADSESENSDSE